MMVNIDLGFELSKKQWAGIFAGMVIAVTSIIIFTGDVLMYFLLVVSLIIAFLPFVFAFFLHYQNP